MPGEGLLATHHRLLQQASLDLTQPCFCTAVCGAHRTFRHRGQHLIQQPACRLTQRLFARPDNVDRDPFRPAARLQFDKLAYSKAADHPARNRRPAETKRSHFQQHQITGRRPHTSRQRRCVSRQVAVRSATPLHVGREPELTVTSQKAGRDLGLQ